MLSVKDLIPSGLRAYVVHNFLCAGCSASYVGETTRNFYTRVWKHLVSGGTAHIFRRLQNSQQCRTLCSHDCFNVLDHASTSVYTYSVGATYIKSPTVSCQFKTFLTIMHCRASFCCCG